MVDFVFVLSIFEHTRRAFFRHHSLLLIVFAVAAGCLRNFAPQNMPEPVLAPAGLAVDNIVVLVAEQGFALEFAAVPPVPVAGLKFAVDNTVVWPDFDFRKLYFAARLVV